MANIKELRGRIKSVGNISKITRAMEMVASMKLRKVQGRALGFRPYTEEIRQMIGRTATSLGGKVDSALFTERQQVRTTGVLLITSDRGLCGAYNTNTLARFHALERELQALGTGRKLKLYVIGRKGYSYLHRRGYDIERFFSEPTLEKMQFAEARMVGKALVDGFVDGTLDDVRIVHTSFEAAARFRPMVREFLPLTSVPTGLDAAEAASRTQVDYLLEPDPETLFERLIPKYLETVVFNAMLSGLASEFASRRMAMKGATDAASRMGKDLKRVYNRARQESITKELLDIIGGASAVA